MRPRAIAPLALSLALFACMRPAVDGDRDPMVPILAHEAALPRELGPACVQPSTEGVAFGRDRQLLRSLRAEHPRNPRDAAVFQRELARQSTRGFEWRLPLPIGAQPFERIPRLDPQQATELDAAARALIAVEPAPAPAITLNRAAILPPLRIGGRLPPCSRLTLTAPAVAGDIAFVETSYVCGSLCGNGWLYALRRQNGQWRLAAIAFTWIS